jgi:hypothetical protein
VTTFRSGPALFKNLKDNCAPTPNAIIHSSKWPEKTLITKFGTPTQPSTRPTLLPGTFSVLGEPLSGDLDVFFFEIEALVGSSELLCG